MRLSSTSASSFPLPLLPFTPSDLYKLADIVQLLVKSMTHPSSHTSSPPLLPLLCLRASRVPSRLELGSLPSGRRNGGDCRTQKRTGYREAGQ